MSESLGECFRICYVNQDRISYAVAKVPKSQQSKTTNYFLLILFVIMGRGYFVIQAERGITSTCAFVIANA